MYSEARKLHLIEEVIKLKSDDALKQIEHILKTSSKKQPKQSAAQLVGKISKKDLELMDKAIEEGCEQISPDDWK